MLVPLGPALSVAFFLWWELAHRGVYAYSISIYPIDDADEWRYTACSRLVAHGYHLFDQVFSAQPPLLFVSLAGAMKVSGETIVGARSAEIALGLVALLASVWLGWQLGGRWAGAAAGALLAVSPGFLVYAHTIEAEGPMMALSVLALALGVTARRRDSLWLAVLSGVALAGAVLFKLFALEAALPLAWALAGVWPLDRRVLLRAVSGAAGALVPLALDFGLVSPLYQWRQVIELHDRAASAALPNLLPPTQILGDFLSLDAGLSVLALAGLVILLLARRVYAAGMLALWLPGSIVMLLLFRPLFPHHAAILTAPLAVCAAVGAGTVLGQAPARCLLSALLAFAGLIYLAFVPRLAHDDRHLLLNPPGGPDPLVAWVSAHTSPGQFVAPDDVRIADLADRLVPPPLCDPSTVRAKAGYLTTADLIAATERYRPVLVLPTGVFADPGYLRWLRTHYRPVRAPGGVSAYLITSKPG